MKGRLFASRLLVGCASLLLVGCASSAPSTGRATTPSARAPLYSRLGGKEAITAVVESFVGRVAADARINARFANADLAHLKLMLVEQICEASGGPCKYTGKEMKSAHTGMQVTGLEWSALVEDLQGSLDQLKVPAGEQQDLLGALAPMKPQIVGQ